MSLIHRTTLAPTKLELLASWLPAQSWYAGGGDSPELTKAGGFRLDDPEGEVGIEFMVATVESGEGPVSYQVPLTYRGAPLAGADHALIGTTEHGVLGQRWVYDGAHDPVLVSQLFALIIGEAEPQAQSTSNTPDPTVTSSFTEPGHSGAAELRNVTDLPGCTDVVLRTAAKELTIRVNRILRPGDEAAVSGVTAGWLLPDGTQVRGPFAVIG